MKNFIDELIEDNKIEINNSEENINYIRQAYLYWKENSDDKDTWTWALIVKDGKILSSWTNRLANWITVTEEKLERPKKYSYLDHAERNAIYNAAKKWIVLEWTTMFMPWVPCSPCAIAIINSWIKKLVMHYSKIIKTPSDWLDDVQDAINMLIEVWVELMIIDEKVWACESKLRWEIWYP